MERQVSSLFETMVGERAWPLAEAGAVMMALPLIGAGTMWVCEGNTDDETTIRDISKD